MQPSTPLEQASASLVGGHANTYAGSSGAEAETPRLAAEPEAKLFARARALKGTAALDMWAKVTKFVEVRRGREAAERTLQILADGSLDDVGTLAALRRALGEPAQEAPSREPPTAARRQRFDPAGEPPQPAARGFIPISVVIPPPRLRPSQPPPRETLEARREARQEARPVVSDTRAPAGHGRARPQGPSGRGRSRTADIRRELEDVKTRKAAGAGRAFAYLDVGCSEGQITAAIAEELGLSRRQAQACDVAPQPENRAFEFSRCTQAALPYSDGTFDLITMFMSAHHFADAVAMLREVFRVARPGARILMREHDCSTLVQSLFYDVVHALYACVFSREETPESFVLAYSTGKYATYRSLAEWVSLAESVGLATVPGHAPHGPWIAARGDGRRGGHFGSDQFNSVYIYLERAAAPASVPASAPVSAPASAGQGAFEGPGQPSDEH